MSDVPTAAESLALRNDVPTAATQGHPSDPAPEAHPQPSPHPPSLPLCPVPRAGTCRTSPDALSKQETHQGTKELGPMGR